MLIPSVLGLIRVGQTGFVSTVEKEAQKALNDTLRSLRGILQSGENGYVQEGSRSFAVMNLHIPSVLGGLGQAFFSF